MASLSEVLSLMCVDPTTLKKLYLAGAQKGVRSLLTTPEWRLTYFHRQLEIISRRNISNVLYSPAEVDWELAYRLYQTKILHCPGGVYLTLALELGAINWSLELAGLHGIPPPRMMELFDPNAFDVEEELSKAFTLNHANVVEFLMTNREVPIAVITAGFQQAVQNNGAHRLLKWGLAQGSRAA